MDNNTTTSKQKSIKIGFISDHDPLDRRPWSGTKNRLYEQVKECSSEIVWIKVSYDWTTYLFRAFLKLTAAFFGKRYSSVHTTFISKRLAASISKEEMERVDILFAPSGGQYIAYLKTTKPIVYLLDATFHGIYDYYPDFSNFLSFNRKQGEQMEYRALKNASHIIASSDWSKDSVIGDYGIDPSKVSVIEFGANVNMEDICNHSARSLSRPALNKRLQLLFIGVEWERKGGDIAVACVQSLNEMGIPSDLYVIGTSLPSEYKHLTFLKEVGFLNKNIPEQYDRFVSIMQAGDFLLLPTRAECSAIAFCEASAYGLPTLTYDTGGIPNYVKNGVNGYRLPLSANGEDFAEKIKSILDAETLDSLSKSSQAYYTSCLNWQTWREKFRNLMAVCQEK